LKTKHNWYLFEMPLDALLGGTNALKIKIEQCSENRDHCWKTFSFEKNFSKKIEIKWYKNKWPAVDVFSNKSEKIEARTEPRACVWVKTNKALCEKDTYASWV
jgi:hypothetical protein